MGYFIYFALFAIQLTSTLATQPVPLKCFLQDHPFVNIFEKITGLTSNRDVSASYLEKLDNVRADLIQLDQDGLQFDVKDVEIQWLKDAILDDFGFNMRSNITRISFHTDARASCLYKVGGFLFLIPVEGEGACRVTYKNVQLDMILPFEIIEKDGNKYIELKKFDYWFDVIDKAEFEFSNLYYGDKGRSEAMHDIINQNWKFLTIQYGRVFMDKIIEKVYNVLRNYMLESPLKNFATC